MTAPAGPKHTERIPTHIAESYAGRGVVHGEWRAVVRDLATDLVAARAQRDALQPVADHARLTPMGFAEGRIVTGKGTTDGDIIEWLATLARLVREAHDGAAPTTTTKGPTR